MDGDPGRRWRTDAIGWLMCLPALAIFGVFYVGPALVGFYISLHVWNGSSPRMDYVGAANYLQILGDGRFWHAVLVTALALAAMLLVKLPLALVLAAGLATPGRFKRFFRAAFFLPHVLSTTMVAAIWIFLLDPYQGLVNFVLRHLGLADWQRGWLGEAGTALPSVLIGAIWWTFGLYVVLFSAGIARIPKDYYDAVRLETKSAWHALRHVTIPMLREQIFVACIMTTGGVFGVLTGFFMLLTAGGPAGRTEQLGILSYLTAFKALEFGRASAISVVVLVVIFSVIVWPTLRMARQRLEF